MSTGALQAFGPEIWLSDGAEVEVIGFRYPTRMAVIRLPEGALLIWSPIALSDGLREALAGLGEVRFLIAPNSLHHLFLAEWRLAFPSAKLYAAPGLKARRPDLEIDAELDEVAQAAWAGVVEQQPVRGNRITTEVVFFHRPSGAVLFTDLLQQFPRGWFRGWRGLVARLDLMTESEPTVPRKFRTAFVDKPAARQSLRRILDWPAIGVVVAHGRPVTHDGRAFIARAFAWLTR
ncbi:MAG TPA: DUF4336 domain-containing protein [Phenylobacterium sp.]